MEKRAHIAEGADGELVAEVRLFRISLAFLFPDRQDSEVPTRTRTAQ